MSQRRGERRRKVALVDDAMSAGSSLRATYTELQAAGAIPAVVGALIVFANRGSAFFRDQGVPIELLVRDE